MVENNSALRDLIINNPEAKVRIEMKRIERLIHRSELELKRGRKFTKEELETFYWLR